MSWSTPFFDPIILPDGRKLITLKDAATYITSLPKKEAALPEWHRGADVVQPRRRPHDGANRRIEALHRNVVREFKSDRKETHWGKRKLKRDQ